MTSLAPPSMSPDLVARLRRAAPAIGILLLLVLATLLPIRGDALRLASPDRSHVDQMRRAIGDLRSGDLVLVAMDADLGTYPEIRAATRAAIADVAAHGAQLAIVSFTAEGRAIAAAERERIARQGTQAVPADLGFVAGAEAGMVRSIASIVPAGAGGPILEAIRAGGGGIGAFAMVLIVSGSDISARSWVEQVGSRLPETPMVTIAPTFLDPELEPYLRSGQLSAVLATLREGVAYAEAVTATSDVDPGPITAPLPMLVGLLAALVVLAESAFRRLTGQPGRPPAGRASP